jgi:hypothetical protein
MNAFGPSSTEPTGAPRPFDRQTETVSKPLTAARRLMPCLTAALQMRAPSRWVARPFAHAPAKSWRRHVVLAQHAAADGVFQRQQAGAREVHVVGLDVGGDVGQRDRAVRLVGDRLRLDTAQHRGAAAFVLVGVRFLADQVFVAAAAVGHQRDQVALRAAGANRPAS